MWSVSLKYQGSGVSRQSELGRRSRLIIGSDSSKTESRVGLHPLRGFFRFARSMIVGFLRGLFLFDQRRAMADPITDALTASALGPKSAQTGMGKVESHPLPDQIEAAKFVIGQAAAKTNKLGIRFRRFKPPGAVLYPSSGGE
jgi:hypothetical protein